MTIDRTQKRDDRDARRRKRRPVHGRSLQHIVAAVGKRARRLKEGRRGPQL